VKLTGELEAGYDGRNVNPVDRGGGVARTFTVFELVALWDGEDVSVTVSVTVNA